MSILLDALKKSEEQRQLGSTPTIHSASAGSAGGAASELQWLPLSMMAFSAIVMAWIGWNQFREPTGLETVDPVSVTAEASAEPAVATRSSADGEQAGIDLPAPEGGTNAVVNKPRKGQCLERQRESRERKQTRKVWDVGLLHRHAGSGRRIPAGRRRKWRYSADDHGVCAACPVPRHAPRDA